MEEKQANILYEHTFFFHSMHHMKQLRIDWSKTMQNLELNLVFGGHFVFWPKMQRVTMNYLAKSEAYSLKIEWVMLNLVFGGHFVFWQKNVEGHYELPCKIWSFQLENWMSYAQFSFWRPFCFWRPFYFLNCVMSRGSLWTPIQNLELLT